MKTVFIVYLIVAFILSLYTLIFAYKHLEKWSWYKRMYYFFLSPLILISLLFNMKKDSPD